MFPMKSPFNVKSISKEIYQAFSSLFFFLLWNERFFLEMRKVPDLSAIQIKTKLLKSRDRLVLIAEWAHSFLLMIRNMQIYNSCLNFAFPLFSFGDMVC